MQEASSLQHEIRSWRAIYFNAASIPFWAIHLAAMAGVALSGWSWRGFLLAIGMYYLRMFFLTAGYHRYFSHRTYKTSRAFQLILAVMGQTCAQMGALWWASNHRAHHKYSDKPGDLHSPVLRGFWWAHMGWFLAGDDNETDFSRITDFAKYPELVWLNQRSVGLLPPTIMAIVCGMIGGFHGLLWGFFVSTVLLWHGTFTINSLAHIIGRRRYDTTDDSRNHWALAVITMGEGWDNNHHYHQSSTAQGFFWWELDPSYYILRGLAALGIVWDLRKPPPAALTAPFQGKVVAKPTEPAASDPSPART